MYYVYRCYDARGALLYVGLTRNFAQRMACHRSNSPWFGKVTRTTQRAVGNNRQLARSQEVAAIMRGKPIHNRIDVRVGGKRFANEDTSKWGIIRRLDREPKEYWAMMKRFDQRRKTMTRMRRMGLSYTAIGEKFGISRQRARAIIVGEK